MFWAGGNLSLRPDRNDSLREAGTIEMARNYVVGEEKGVDLPFEGANDR